MKKVLIILLLMIMSGCAENTSAKTAIDNQINSISMMEVNYDNNNYKDLYSYYTNEAIGKISSNEISTVLSYSGHDYVMSLKVNEIINDEFYNNELREEYNLINITYQGEGVYKSTTGVSSYFYQVYSLNEDDYLLLMDTEYFSFSAISDHDFIDDLAYEMINTAKSVIIDKEIIINTYSNKDIIDYEKETIKLFEIKIPENGSLEDMIGTDPETGMEIDPDEGYIEEDELRKEELRNLEDSDDEESSENDDTEEEE